MSDLTNQNQKDDSGMPKIAQKEGVVSRIGVIAISIVLVLFGLFYLHSKISKKQGNSLEETYTIQADNQDDAKKASSPTGLNGAPKATTTAMQATQSVDPQVMQQQMVIVEEKQKELQQRLTSPLMVTGGSGGSTANPSTAVATLGARDSNSQFLNQVSSQDYDAAFATSIGSLNTVIAEGSFIHANLEPAINSDLPGYLRASVSEPVYSEDGNRVLIPIGSRLIGQYKNGILQGQTRVFIAWTRLITPDGISISLGSEGVDSLGEAGMNADVIDRHFWQRFGTASLLSLLGAGASNVGVGSDMQDNSASTYRSAVASSFAQSAEQSLQDQGRIAQTLKIWQGKTINVFIAKDLHFENVIQQTKSKINIF